ncbi:MAG: MBL fold metallo-hydrolase [Candidatus Scalinduaceae bacterium]
MKLTILGSGTGIVTARRGSSGYLVCINDKSLLIDSGSGTLKKLTEASSSYKEIDYAIYTHFHPDHVVDLISLLFALRIPNNDVNKKLTIIGPTGMNDLYQNLSRDFNNFIEPRGYELDIKELLEGYIDFEDFKITSSLVKHLDNSVAYRVESEDGKTLVYSGDTDYCESMVNLATDVDVLLLECSYPKHMRVEGHLNSTLAGRIARESNCKKLVLTHFYPICDEYDILGQCKEEFKGKIILAEDLMSIEI